MNREPNVELNSRLPLTRRWAAGSVVVAFVLAFIQAPGLTVADTKYDLTQNPLGFLARASHLWNSAAPLGQVQNQAYGYFFPHGAFFSAGHAAGVPAWVSQRIWWALLLLAGFWGIVRLAEALGVGNRGSRVVAGVAFALCPRVLTTLGSISSETLPMMLAPWVLLGPVLFAAGRGSTRIAAQSAAALALMGAVNAVATAAAALPALLWFATLWRRPGWGRFAARWLPMLALATMWWAVPLLILGKVSPPFLDYIESSRVTTEWASLGEVLRGTDSWTPFVSPERIAGAVLVTQPAAVLATGLLAAAGMAGLAMRSMPARGRLALILCVGLVGIGVGFVGELGSPIAEQVRVFLDAGGAPLRNVHKLEPLIRIPLVLGLAQLLARVPLPGAVPFRVWRGAFAHPERDPMVALAGLVLAALTLATALAWTGKLAPRGAYERVPEYWSQTADWLAANAPDTRALVVPGAPFASQVWGLTRDEPLQALASTPWAVRDAVPLTPPGAIRAMDSIQRLLADGRPSTGMAAALIGQGIGIVVLRNDLDPETSRSTRPLLVHQAINGSPGISKVAEFGPYIRTGRAAGIVADGDMRPDYPAIEIYRVSSSKPGEQAQITSGVGAPPAFPGAYTAPLAEIPVVAGGPEVAERLGRARALGPVLLAADARRAGLPVPDVVVTDTPVDRETDFGQVDNHSSAIRARDDPRRTHNLVPDYVVPDTPLVQAQWSGGRISVSGSAADATQLGGSAPGSGAAAAVDGDPATSWVSRGIDSAVGQWLQVDLDKPISSALVRITVSPAAIGAAVKWIAVSTPHGTTSARVAKAGEPVTVSMPPGRTTWVRITATQTDNGKRGSQFGISELILEDFSSGVGVPVPIVRRVVVPPPPAGAVVRGWDLGQELPGRGGCYTAPNRVRCSKSLALAPEELGSFNRTLTVPETETVHQQLTVRARQGPALESLLTDPARPIARGAADIGDLRGSAFAATDGDPATSWTAPEDTIRGSGQSSLSRSPAGAAPTLTVELPALTEVTGLELTPSAGQLPARPTQVSVNLGDGPQVRELNRDGVLRLHPHTTQRVEISVLAWKPVLDQTGLGYPQPQPPGLADITVLGPNGHRVGPPPSDPRRLITIDCAHGPVVWIGGVPTHTTVTATADQLITAQPVPAISCGPTTTTLPAGRVDIAVAATSLFVTDQLHLTTTAPPPPVSADRDQLLVLPLSTNTGWRASADGHPLRPVVINGWQQAWLLPPNAGPVTVSFPADHLYRLSIFGGLLLLIPLLLLALFSPKYSLGETKVTNPPLAQAGLRCAGAAGIVVVGCVIAGPIGAAVAGTGAAVLWWRPDVVRRYLPAVAGMGTAVSAAVLSTGPWRFAGGYLGGSVWVQLPALIAVVAVGLAAVPSRRRAASRAGSSTKA